MWTICDGCGWEGDCTRTQAGAALCDNCHSELEYSQGQTESALKIVNKYEAELDVKHNMNIEFEKRLNECQAELTEWKTQAFALKAELDLYAWIPVEERLPEAGDLVFMSDGINCFVGLWFKERLQYVTHWMLIILPDQAGQG